MPSTIEEMKQEIYKEEMALNENKEKLETVKEKFLSEYPHYCIHCGGRGGHIYFYGGSYWEPGGSDFSFCSHCVEKGKHPLDTTKLSSEEEIHVFCEKVSEVVEGYREHSEIPTLFLDFINQEELVRDAEDLLENMRECLHFASRL